MLNRPFIVQRVLILPKFLSMQKAFFPIVAFLILPFALNSFSQNKGKEKAIQSGEKIHWYSFEEAYQLNKKKPKKIFIDVFTDWCGWCRKMDAETFTNPSISEYMSDHFYCVKLNAERKDTVVIDGVKFSNPNPTGKRSTHQLAVELLKGNMSYPSYVFLNEKSQWLTVVAGYQAAKDFEPIIHYFGEDAYEKTPWEDYKASFEGVIK
jgi:thioredoxin-related protein